MIDPDNLDGLNEDFLVDAFLQATGEWDSYTGSNLFGSFSINYNPIWDNNLPDGRNELVFGYYNDEGVIALTLVWGYFSSPPNACEIIEFDILFNTHFEWGDATNYSQGIGLQSGQRQLLYPDEGI